MSKKILIIITVLLLIIIVVLGVLYFRGSQDDNTGGFFGNFFGSGTTLPTSPNTGGGGVDDFTATTTPPTLDENQLIHQITRFPAFGTFIGERIAYYRRDLGHRYHADKNGDNADRISNFTMPAIAKINTPINTTTGLLLSLEDPSTPSYFRLEHVGTSTDALLLDRDVVNAALSPNAARIAYIINTENSARIILADTENQNQQVLYELAERDIELRWVNNTTLLLFSRPSGIRPGSAWLLTTTGSIETILSGVNGLDILFSENSNIFLYSEIDRGTINLRAVNRSQGSISTIPLNTFARKCAWADTITLYCAVPFTTGPADINLPDDWFMGKISFNDVLWKINIETGNAGRVSDFIGFDMVNLVVGDDMLLFNNKKDSTLWNLFLENTPATFEN